MSLPDNDIDGWAVDWEADRLSPLARTAYAVIIALIYETRSEEVELRRVLRGAGITQEQWPAIEAELYDEALAWGCVGDGTPRVTAMTAPGRLSVSIGAPGRPSPTDWAALRREVFERHGEQCMYCSATDDLAIDHVLAISHGGSNHITNLVPACKSCNSAKGSKTWAEWMALRKTRGSAP